MDVLYSFFMGAGVATYTYSKLGRRVGYGNTQNVVTLVAVVFILVTIISYTVFRFILHI